MKKAAMGLVAALALGASAAHADVVYTSVQCWAEGHSLRVRGTSSAEFLVDSRLNLRIAPESEGAGLIQYLGHVEIAKFIEPGQKKIAQADYYAAFHGQDIAKADAPRARRYPDSAYLRYKDFDATITTSHDGGGMWGYLVVGREALAQDNKTFKAHYVFQAGDHTGGTIDYECQRD